MAINFVGVLPSSLFNDSAWPSSSNRPTFSGSTLSWIGPSSGGANNGSPVQQNLTLSASGSVSSTANNQIIEGLNISGGMTISHNNVTVRRCKVAAVSNVCISIVPGATGTLIEDCLIDGTGGGSNGISHFATFTISNVTVRRNNILGFENHITSAMIDCVAIDNWFHASDGSAGKHADQCECYGGTSNFLIQHNTFDGRDRDTELNAGVNVSNSGGSVLNVQVINNRFIQCGDVFACCDGIDFSVSPVTWSATNNGFWNCVNYRRDGPNGSTPSPNSGNFDMAVVDSQSGSLINGTGVM